MHSSASVSKVGPCYASVAYNVVHNVAHNVAHNVVCIYTMLQIIIQCRATSQIMHTGILYC